MNHYFIRFKEKGPKICIVNLFPEQKFFVWYGSKMPNNRMDYFRLVFLGTTVHFRLRPPHC